MEQNEIDENPIYDFLKANKLTDKDEGSFLKEYADSTKANELHQFFSANKLTDKDFNTFYDSYLKPAPVKMAPVPTDAYSFNKVLNPVAPAKPLPQPKPLSVVAEPVNSNAIKAYENTQGAAVKTDKQLQEVDRGDNGFLVPQIIIDLEDDIFLGKKFAKDEKKRELQKTATVQGNNADAALKALRPEIDKAIEKVTPNISQFVTSNNQGFEIPDVYKINEFARQQAKDAGVKEDGFFKDLLYNEVKANISNKIIEPSVDKKFAELYKKETGKTVEEDLGADFTTGFKAGSKIEHATKIQVGEVQKNVKVDTEAKVQTLHNALSEQVNVLNNTIKQKAEQVTAQFAGLIKEGKFTGTEEQYQQYQQATEAVKKEEDAAKGQYQILAKQFINEQNIISTKANARYRRQVAEISKGAEAKYNEALKTYQSAYQKNPELKGKIEKIYKQAYGEVVSSREDLKGAISSIKSTGESFVNTFLSSLGGSIKGISSSLNFDAGKIAGDYLENQFEIGSAELKNFSDLLNVNKLVKSTGQLVGSMLPGLVATVAATAITRGAGGGATLQLITAGAAGWGAETMDIAGRMYEDKFAESGDAVKAQKAAQETFKSQILLAPTYALEGLPFMGKAIKLGKTLATRALVGGAIEVGTEMMQEYPQNLFEEAIKTDGTFKTALNYHSTERLKNTALNIAPVFLLGLGGQVSSSLQEKANVEDNINSQAKAFAQKVKFADFAPSQREQFLFDVMQRNGQNFTSAYLLSSFTSGQIDKAEFNDLSKTLVKSANLIDKAKELGLTPAQLKIFSSFSNQYEKAKAVFEAETDPLLKAAAEAQMKDYEKQVTNFASKKEADYAVLTYANNEQYVYTHEEMQQALQDTDFADQVKKGDLKVAVFGKNEMITNRLAEINAPAPANKEVAAMADEMKAALAEIGGEVVPAENKPKNEQPAEVDKPVLPDAAVPEVQADEKVVPENVDGSEQGGAVGASPVLKKGDAPIPASEVEKAQAPPLLPKETKGVLDNSYTEIEKDVWDNVLSKKKVLTLPNKKALAEYKNLIDNKLVYEDSFGGGKSITLRLTEKGEALLNNKAEPISVAKEQAQPETVETLRAQEKADLKEAIPNIEYKEDGKVDVSKLSKKDAKKFKEIYDKYDKLITLLLEKKDSKPPKVLKKRAKPTVKDKDMLAVWDLDPGNPDIIVAQYFIGGGTVGTEAIEDLFGQKKVSGIKSIIGELRARISYLRKDGKSIKELAHFLWDNATEAVQDMYDDQKFREAVESFISNFNHRKQMAVHIVEKYGLQQDEKSPEEKHFENMYDPEIEQGHEELTDDQANELMADEDLQMELAALEDMHGEINILQNEEARLANEKINIELAEQIIKDEGLTLENIDEAENLFKGFPYTPVDFINVKKILQDGKRQGDSKPAANEQEGAGDAENKAAGVQGEKGKVPGKNKNARQSAKNIAALQKSVDTAQKELDAAEESLAKNNAVQADIFGNAAVQKDLIPIDPEDVKKRLNTLKKKLKEAKAALETAQNREVKDERQGAMDLPEGDLPVFSAKKDVDAFHTSNNKTPATLKLIKEKYPDVIVVQSQNDLPKEIRDEADAQAIDVEGVYHKGEVYLVADNISTMGRADAVYRHEKVGHQGVINELGKKLTGFTTQLVDTAAPAQKTILTKIAMDRYGKKLADLKADQKSILGQEYIARIAEDPKNYPKTWDKILTFVRQTLRAMGINLSISDTEIKVLLGKAAKNTAKANSAGPLFQIGGEKAKMQDNVRKNLDAARAMEEAGKNSDEIYLATGWERGADSKWRFELPDLQINTDKLQATMAGGDTELSNIVDDGELFKAYPELKNAVVVFMPDDSANGSYTFHDYYYNDKTGEYENGKHVISLNTKLLEKNKQSKLQSVLIHEVQHAIQQIEAFAQGGSVGNKSIISNQEMFDVITTDVKFRQDVQLVNEVQKILKTSNDIRFVVANLKLKGKALKNKNMVRLSGKIDPIMQYLRLGGEVEARNAQTRMSMTADEKTAKPFSITEDVARKDQIKLFGAGKQQSTPLFSSKETNLLVKQAAQLIKEMQANGKTITEMVDAATDFMDQNWEDAKWGPIDTAFWRNLFASGLNTKIAATAVASPSASDTKLAREKYKAATRIVEPKKPGFLSRNWTAFKNLSFFIDNPNRYITKLQQDIEKTYNVNTKNKIPLGRAFEQKADGEGFYRVREFLNNVTAGLNKKQLEGLKEYFFWKRIKDRNTQQIHNDAFGIEGANRETGNITLQDAEAALAEIETAMGAAPFADFVKRGEAMQLLMDNTLQRLVASGRLSQDAYDAIKMENDFYAPFAVVQNLTRYDDGSGAPTMDASVVKRIKGISYKGTDFSFVTIEDAQKAYTDGIITKAEFYQISTDYLDQELAAGNIIEAQHINEMAKLGDSGFVITDILDKTANIIFNTYRIAHKNELMNRLAKLQKFDTDGAVMQKVNGFELKYDKDGNATSIPKRLGDIKVPEGFGVISFFTAGKQKFLAVELKAANTINMLDKLTLPGWAKAFNTINAAFRLGVITLSPGFQLANMIIDTVRSAAFSRYGLFAGKSIGDGVANAVLFIPQYMNAIMVAGAANVFNKHSKLYEEFMKSRAYSSGMFDDPFLSKDRKLKVSPKSFVEHVKYGGIDKLFHLIEGIGKTFEQSHKIVSMERGMDIDAGIRMGVSRWKNLISQAKTPVDMVTAMDQIAYETQNFAGSPNFPATHGIMKVMSVVFQFLSARVKGEMTDYRRIATMFGGNAEGLKISKKERAQLIGQFAAVVTPIVYMAMKNHDDDEEEKELKTMSPYDLENNMLIPSGTFQYEDDGGNTTTHREYIKIPLRGVTSTINVIANSFAEYAKTQDPELLKNAMVKTVANASPLTLNGNTKTEYFESIWANLTPPLKASYELPSNRDAFKHRERIPAMFGKNSLSGQYDRGQLPYLIATRKTSDWAVKVSQYLYDDAEISITPITLDYLHSTFLGNVGSLFDTNVIGKRILRSEGNYPVYQDFGGPKK